MLLRSAMKRLLMYQDPSYAFMLRAHTGDCHSLFVDSEGCTSSIQPDTTAD